MQGSPTKIHGLSTKLLTIPTEANKKVYNLGSYESDDLDQGSKVVAIIVRIGKNNNYKSIDDRPLIKTNEAKKGYLSLVNYETNGRVLQNCNLQLLKIDNIENYYGIFIEPCRISWSMSALEFSPSVNFDGSKDIELNILFTTTCQQPISTNILFDNGFSYNAAKKRTIEIKVEGGKQSFSINQNPLSDCDTLVGLRYNNFPYETTTENANVPPEQLFASFLTMMVGSRALLQDFPLVDLTALHYIGYPYFPIEPTKANDFDWKKCKVTLPNKNLSTADTSYLITLYYI